MPDPALPPWPTDLAVVCAALDREITDRQWAALEALGGDDVEAGARALQTLGWAWLPVEVPA